jgi:hypothetical protein
MSVVAPNISIIHGDPQIQNCDFLENNFKIWIKLQSYMEAASLHNMHKWYPQKRIGTPSAKESIFNVSSPNILVLHMRSMYENVL